MTQAPEVETMQLQIVSCETCDGIFLVSPRRQTCPTCGGPAGVEFFTFDVGPAGVTLLESLANVPLAATNGSAPAEDAAAPPAAAAEEVSAGLPFRSQCPSCGVGLDVRITDSAVTVELPLAEIPDAGQEPETLTTSESPPEGLDTPADVGLESTTELTESATSSRVE